jgi:Holliday junction resolvasome RuvABC endonuclease subunit
MILLALDPNTVATGYIIYDNDTAKTLCSGTIKTPSRAGVSLSERMVQQRDMLDAIIASQVHSGKVDFVFVEGIFFGTDPSVPINLALLTGILIGGLCSDFGRIPATTWRKRTTGSGKKDYDGKIKDSWKTSASFDVAKNFLGHEPLTEHEMDATSILLAYLNGGKWVKSKRKRKRKK